jgi:hypothetical protein
MSLELTILVHPIIRVWSLSQNYHYFILNFAITIILNGDKETIVVTVQCTLSVGSTLPQGQPPALSLDTGST